MTIAMIYGWFSSGSKVFNPDALYSSRGLTGSESSFFNLAIEMSKRGHSVTVFCPCLSYVRHESGAWFVPLNHIHALKSMRQADAVISWNEPDYLSAAPEGALRVVDQQLNDWPYCQLRGWQSFPDVYVFPSISSRENHRKDRNLMSGIGGAEMAVIPNSCNTEHFKVYPSRNPHRAIWASSPDRGLHHLLGFWSLVKQRVPDAELRIFYDLRSCIDSLRGLNTELGRRVRLIEQQLQQAEQLGINVIGPVSNLRMAEEYCSAGVLVYPCDPVSYTEGFGCTVLDACAGGCVPIISTADALPEVHGKAAIVVQGLDQTQWASAVISAMESPPNQFAAMRHHADAHSRQNVADEWEKLLLGFTACKSKASAKSFQHGEASHSNTQQ